MENQVLFYNKNLTVKIEDGNMVFYFHPDGWWYDTSCPLTATAIINKSIYKENKDLLNIEIKDYIKDFDKEIFIYWVTGGNSFWIYESWTEFKYAYNELLKEDGINDLVKDVLTSNTIKDAIEIIDRHEHNIVDIVSKYHVYNYDDDDEEEEKGTYEN